MHSISQYFIVLLMRHTLKKSAAVVEQMGGVTVGLPSSQVSLYVANSAAKVNVCMMSSAYL